MKCRDLQGSVILVAPTVGANTEFAVAHEMAVIPHGAFVVLTSSTASLYLGTTPWDKDYAYLKASAAGVQFYAMFFV